MKRYAATLMELSKILGQRYGTLLAYTKLEGWPPIHSPGVTRYDIEACRQFILSKKSAHNHKLNGTNGHSKNGHSAFNAREQSVIDKNNITVEKSKVALAREKFELDVKMGEYIPKTVALREVDTGCSLFSREIDKAIENELPPRLEGLSAVEIKKVLRKKFDQIFLSLHEILSGYRNGSARV